MAVSAGLMSALALPNASIAGLAWIAPGLLLLAAGRGNAFWLGYVGGLTHYLICLSWLLEIPVTFYPILGWIALAAYLALYPALWAWLCSKIPLGGSWLRRVLQALVCAVLWVALEMTVARMFSGFPWNLVGVTQHRVLPLVQIADWAGVYGISFLVVWFSVTLRNAALLSFSRFRGDTEKRNQSARRGAWMQELALPLLATALVYAAGVYRMKRHPEPDQSIKIAMIQPSIPQTMIWNPADSDRRFIELLRLSAAALTNKPNLLIWPEAAVPSLVRDDPVAQEAITSLARTNNVWIIIGADDFDMRGTNRIYYNSSFLVSPAGELAANYRKRRLVIFGEYVPLVDSLPFIKYLTPISGGFAAGDAPVTFKLGDQGPNTSVLICFEDTFAHYAREHASLDVDFLVNITNDGWFGESAAHWQHAVNAAFRSIENRLPLVRCSNNGVTCWIDVNGAIRDVGFNNPKDVYRAGVKIVEVPISTHRERTFYNQHGDWFGWGCVFLSVVAAGAILSRRKSGNRHELSA